MMKTNRGIILIAAYLVIAVLLILGAAFIGRSISEKNIAQRELESLRAFFLAEAGIDHAINELRKDYNWKGITAYLDDKGGYSVKVEDLDGSLKKISSTGFLPNSMSRKLEGVISVKPLYRWAVFGNEKVKVNGSVVIDSYDSSKGPYIGTPIGKNGDVGTNNIVNKSIDLSGSVIIYGDVVVGPEGDPIEAISTSGSVITDGQRTSAESATLLPPVIIPDGLENSGDLKLTGSKTLTLPSGSYWYSSITISGSSTLTTSGEITIYVDGKVDLSGSSVMGVENKPTKLSITVLGNKDVEFTGSNTFSGVFYAPKSEIKISGSVEAYGAMIGKKLDLSGSARFHYDETLNPTGEKNSVQVQIISWRDL